MTAALQGSLSRWTGDGWYTDICQFRGNPSLFLSNNRLTPEALTDDIIQVTSSYRILYCNVFNIINCVFSLH
jgi:hypothetical protein